MQVYPRVACILIHIEAHTALCIPIANNFSVVDQLAPMIWKFSVNSDRSSLRYFRGLRKNSAHAALNSSNVS